MPNIITSVAIHHFGASSSTPLARVSNLTIDDINQLHRSRWPDFPSKLRPDLYVGYNIIIWPSGSYTQARYLGEETAAQKGHNLDTVSICLAGNFTLGAERPTPGQINRLKDILVRLISGTPESIGLKVLPGTVLDISALNIWPHRKFAGSNTQCYGTGLSDSWGLDILNGDVYARESLIQNLQQQVVKLTALIASYFPRKVGAKQTQCWEDARG